MQKHNLKKSFTLVELMIVIAILAILSAIVIFALNPGRLFDNFRDTRRVSDINTINKAINFVETWNTGGISYGSTSTVYISLPDTSSTCSSYSLPTLPTGYTYSCKTAENFRKVDSTGWIPIDFSISNGNYYIPILPIDPTNDTTYFYTYYSGGSYEVTALLKNPNTNSINDDDSLTGAFTMGSPNRTWNTPLSRDTNLVGHWDFNEGSGIIAYDKSGYGNNGTFAGNTSWATLSSGEIVTTHDGSGDTIGAGANNSLNITGDKITIMAWAYTNTTSSNQVIANKVKYEIKFYVDNKMYFGIYSGGFKWANTIKNDFNIGTWYHICISHSNNITTWYIDGVMNVAKALAYLLEDSTGSNFTMGSGYNGYFDDVRIYSRALSSAEITEIYNKTKHKYQ